MDEENNSPVEVTTIAEDIREYNQNLERQLEALNEWKVGVMNMQEQFVDKLKKKTLKMKIE